MDDHHRDESLPTCVVNCVVYDRAGGRRDISLDAISDVLAADDGSFVWVGLYEPEDALLDKNLVFAQTMAEKAATLAKQLPAR